MRAPYVWLVLLACAPQAGPKPDVRAQLKGYRLESGPPATDITPAYILLHACPNWASALEIALNKGGCNAETASDARVRKCRAKIPAPCDICSILKDGNWPSALVEDLPGKDLTAYGATVWARTDETPSGAKVGRVHRDTPGTIPSGHVEFKRALCRGEKNVMTLSKTIFHEALHICKAFGSYGSETEDSWLPFVTDADSVTDFCFEAEES